MIHDLRWLVKDGERVLQYNTCAAGDSRDWHDVLDCYPAVQPTVTISASQFWEACRWATYSVDFERNCTEASNAAWRTIETKWGEVAKRLGLGGEKG